MTDKPVQTVTCDFCSSSEFTTHHTEGEWTIVKCKNCGFHYTNPQPTLETLPFYYTEEYFKDKRHASKFYNEDGTQKTVVENYTNRIEDIETFLNKRGSLLELGSARGGFLSKMKSRGWKVFGVEISEDAAQIANDNDIPTFTGTLEQWETDQKFDAVCMYQTLEHVPNPREIIEKSFDLLNPGGVFIAEIPNIQCSEMKISKERRHLSYDLPRHLNHFSPDFLKKALEKAGFEVIDIDRYPPKFILKLLQMRSKPGPAPSGNQSAAETQGQETQTAPPMSKKPMGGTGQKVIRTVSKWFPGWRFTITARKPVK